MPTPFICRQCAARLARSTSQIPRPGQLIHMKVFPAERSSQTAFLSPRNDRTRTPDLPHPKDEQAIYKEEVGIETADTPSSPFSSPRKDETTSVPQTCWNGEVKKYVPWRSRAVQQLATSPLAANARELKAKILGASGDYRFVHGDLMSLYGLSHTEARHAIGQLERLLWGHQEIKKAALRLDQYLTWKKNFATLVRNAATTPIPDGNDNTVDVNGKAAAQDNDVASMKTAWQRLDQDRRERLWPQMVLSVLESESDALTTLVRATFDSSWCPSYVVEDMLYVLFRRYQVALETTATGNCDQRQHTIEAIGRYILNNCSPRYLGLEQTILLTISRSMSNSELLELYQKLKTIEHPLHANTLLQFASRFAKAFDTKVYAADILHSLTKIPKFDLNTPAAASVCTSLLTLNDNEPLPDEHAAPDVLFEFLLERGLRPNLLGLSALMRNFCIRGHLDTAWKIFDLMLQHGLEPDPHVYSILLNGSKRNLDVGSTEQIFNIIKSRNAWSPILINDFLDLLFRENESQAEKRRRQRKKSNNAWRPMLHLYAKFFDLAPLQKLTLFSLENMLATWGVKSKYSTPSTRIAETLPPQPDNRLIQPNSITLCLMLGAHMRSILTPKYVIRYYNHFFKLVEEKDPIAMSLLANHGTLVFDIFLRALMQFRETTRFAIHEIQKMISVADAEKAQYGRNIHHHPPSVHTWTILLNGFKNHRNTLGAVGVLNMMANVSHSQPTLATWNALIQAFALTGNVNGAVKAIQSLEKAGFHPDDRTVKAFNTFPRALREQAIARLEEMRKSHNLSKLKSSSLDPITKSDRLKPNRVHQISPDDPIQQPRSRIAHTLEQLAEQQETWDIKKIEAYSRRQRSNHKSRVSKELNPSQPIRP
ncbi:hypothetical protein F5Y19DRAFT_471031 [Xylariaceae sp. FL1651]|nr:hypothetical protein F5Y19DRAFT_471031 [Xylariaceae sp. FL1651]